MGRSKKETVQNEQVDSDIEEMTPKKTQNDQIIDLVNSIFNYKDTKFSYVIANDQVYFKGKEIAEFLEYSNSREAIREHVK